MSNDRLDEYGFAAAALLGLRTFDLLQRRTGRTTRLLARIAAGDAVIVATAEEKRRMEREVRSRFGAVNRPDAAYVVQVDPEDVSRGFRGLRGQRFRRVFMDHEFVRRFIDAEIRRGATALDVYRQMTSYESGERDDDPAVRRLESSPL